MSRALVKLSFFSKNAVVKDWQGNPSGQDPLPKITDPRFFDFVLHDHKAEKAGRHLDLRLGNPSTQTTYNWAIRKLPKPGEIKEIFPTGHHPYEYLDFRGKLTGYGQGTVDIARKEKAEVLRSDPRSIKFNLYSGRVPEQYAIRSSSQGKWYLQNITPSRDQKVWKKLVPIGRPKYKEEKANSVDLGDDRQIAQGKIDGAHSAVALRPGKIPRVFSYRKAKAAPTGFIEHTFKLPNLLQERVPEDIKDTVVRAELYGVDRKGKAIASAMLGGMLNASTLKSREMQTQKKVTLKLAPFDVVRYGGKEVEKLPYDEKFEILKSLADRLPGVFTLPPHADTPSGKARLLSRIKAGKEKVTKEGIVLWDKEKGIATKVKLKPEFDVKVTGVFPSEHRGWAGGFTYSTKAGEGRVGTGFTQKMRQDMLKHPGKYKGLVAKVESQEVFPSGALRAPSFKSWHLDLNPQKRLEKLSFRLKEEYS